MGILINNQTRKIGNSLVAHNIRPRNCIVFYAAFYPQVQNRSLPALILWNCTLPLSAYTGCVKNLLRRFERDLADSLAAIKRILWLLLEFGLYVAGIVYVEVGPVSVGLNMFTKTVGEEGVGSSVELGFKDLLSVQGTRDNAYSSGSLSWSATILGFNKDLSTPLLSRSGWSFQPAKEFRLGVQALVGVEFGLNTDKYQQTVNHNRACGYYDHD